MTTLEKIALYGIIIAWDTLWLQLIVIQFFSKREKLHLEYVESGVKDVALSYIESQRLIPILAEMFERAHSQQEDQRKKIVMEELLQSVDFISHLERAEAAMQDKKAIEDAFDFLQNCADRIWIIGLAHVLLMVLVPWALDGQLAVLKLLLLLLAALSFVAMIWDLVRLSLSRRTFLNQLQSNRQPT